MSPSKKRNRLRKNEEDDDNDSIESDEEGIELPDSEQTRATRNKIEGIQEKLKCYQDNQQNGLLSEILKEAQETTKDVRNPQEAHKDNKMFSQVAKAVRMACEGTPDTERKFMPSEFAMKMGKKLNAPEAPANESGFRFKKAQMVALGQKYAHCFRRAPTMKFVLGTLDPDIQNDEKKEKKKATARPRDKIAAATKTAIVGKAQATEAKTDRFVKTTKKCLDAEYKQNRKQPICYFRFVIDPDSFGKTVENMFHVSFLVKQRSVLLAVGKNGLPTLEPCGRGGGDQEGEDSVIEQAVISLDMEDWEELKTNLKITKRAIDDLV